MSRKKIRRNHILYQRSKGVQEEREELVQYTKEARSKSHLSKLVYNILYINGDSHKLKQLKVTETYPYFGSTEEKDKVRRRTYTESKRKHKEWICPDNIFKGNDKRNDLNKKLIKVKG